ncbi:MAG: bifunctional folylpolyglutamate synthase/dihydrofolate synthase [Ahrensia sp.]|nr:bifunctional folylpolyglutamate synthase/dihydrofolate synthase [Ahrensia sp.]
MSSLDGPVEQRIAALSRIHPKGFDLSLERITRLLSTLGDPHQNLPPTIHVAGTNGKGSTIAFARSILEASGLLVHAHTSPHLVRWNERYRLAGKLVDDETLCDAIDRVADVNDGQPITVFEILTAVAFLLFSEHEADACLVEVGLGGRFDCTNVMAEVAVSVIAPVSMDHEMHLGDTIAKIAFEKAGIIRPKVPVVVGPQHYDALGVIERQAAKLHAPVVAAGQHYHARVEQGRLVFQDETALLDLSLPRLPGQHQIDNAGLAIAACRMLAERQNLSITETACDAGLTNAQWPARLQLISQGRLVELLPPDTELWVDGGHNEAAADMVARHICALNDRNSLPLVLVCGMLTTKNPATYLAHFAGLARKVYTVPIPSSDAGYVPEALATFVKQAGIEALAVADLASALRKASDEFDEMRVLIAGSLYIAGQALQDNETFPS